MIERLSLKLSMFSLPSPRIFIGIHLHSATAAAHNSTALVIYIDNCHCQNSDNTWALIYSAPSCIWFGKKSCPLYIHGSFGVGKEQTVVTMPPCCLECGGNRMPLKCLLEVKLWCFRMWRQRRAFRVFDRSGTLVFWDVEAAACLRSIW